MLSSNQHEVLRDHVYRLLTEVGLKVHSDELAGRLRNCGCRESPCGRLRIPKSLIEEMTTSQTRSRTHHIVWNRQQERIRQRMQSDLLMSAFDCGPTLYYDSPRACSVPVDTNIFIEMMKLAQATPEIGYISTWYRHDVPQETERLESLALGLRYTDKLDGIEAIDPRLIRYLRDISEILTGRAGDSSYLAGSECMTSPLILERRSAEDVLERQRQGVHRYHVASMPTIGVSTPVTLAGAVVMTAAEILGGLAACFAVDPQADLSGRAIALVADMRKANSTCSGPEPALVNLAVKDLFDKWWGGHLWVETFFSPYAKRPGLQAVYENFYGRWRTAKLLARPDIPYPGVGTLNCGATGSPTQLMLDLHIRRSERALSAEFPVDADAVAYEEICRAVQADENFLEHEHTLRRFRELWSSDVFRTEPPSDGWPGDEKAILDVCEEAWRQNLKRFEPPTWPEDTLRAVDEVVGRAKRDLANQ
jgi:trimethylamine--corrinoid protein Co-methyltransferase